MSDCYIFTVARRVIIFIDKESFEPRPRGRHVGHITEWSLVHFLRFMMAQFLALALELTLKKCVTQKQFLSSVPEFLVIDVSLENPFHQI